MEDKIFRNDNEDLQPTDGGETVIYFDEETETAPAPAEDSATVTEVDGAIVVEFNNDDAADDQAEPEVEETAEIPEAAEHEFEAEDNVMPEAEVEEIEVPVVEDVEEPKVEEPKVDEVDKPEISESESAPVDDNNDDNSNNPLIAPLVGKKKEDKKSAEKKNPFSFNKEKPAKKSKAEKKAEKEALKQMKAEEKKAKNKKKTIICLILIILAFAIPVGLLIYTLMPLIPLIIDLINSL